MDYYELNREVYKEHAKYLDTLLAPLHWLDATQEFLEIQKQSMELLDFCQKIEQPLTGRVILLPELWVSRIDWEKQLAHWSNIFLKDPFRYLVFVGAGLEQNGNQPLRRFRPDDEIYLIDMTGQVTPSDVYHFLLRTWSGGR